MFEGTGQAVVVDNKPGADTAIATKYVMRSPPDGRTLLITATSFVFLALKQPLELDIQRDLVPVIKVANGEMLLAIHPALEARTAADLKRAAAARPGGLNCAAVPGQTLLACDRLAQLIGGRMTTVPFQSLAPAVNAVVAGHVDVIFSPRAAVQPLEAQQRLRILATTGMMPAQPPYQDLPMLKDLWPSLRMVTSTSLYAPVDTPHDAIATINREVNRVIALPDVQARLVELGYSLVGGSPEFLARNLADEIGYYGTMMRESESRKGSASR
jgi:tripartite-type tricarboxylate transporter receptor subunit TctC